MKWYLRPIKQEGRKVLPAGSPIREVSSKAAAQDETRELFEDEGLDWQAGALMKTREMKQPHGWFNNKLELMTY